MPTILVRKEAILVRSRFAPGLRAVLEAHLSLMLGSRQVNILHIRALVKADTVILFDTYGSADSRLHSVFLYHLEVSLVQLSMRIHSHAYSTTSGRKRPGLPTSFGGYLTAASLASLPSRARVPRSLTLRPSHRALDSILLSVLSALEAEMVFIRNLVGGLLAELEDDIDHDRFKRLLHYSRRLTSFQSRAKLVSTSHALGLRSLGCSTGQRAHLRVREAVQSLTLRVLNPMVYRVAPPGSSGPGRPSLRDVRRRLSELSTGAHKHKGDDSWGHFSK